MLITNSPRQIPRLSEELLEYYRIVSLQTLTVVDLETTGLNPDSDRVIEVSIVIGDLKSGIQAQHTQLINPEITLPFNTIRFTGITQPMVDYALLAGQIWTEYLPLLNQGILTAHQLSFDYRFLQAEYERLNTKFVRPTNAQLCTVQLSRLLLPDLHSRRLPALVRHFGFKVNEFHRAAPDALACWLLAKKLLTEIQDESDEKLLTRMQRQWINLPQVAEILGCSESEAQTELVKAGLRSRPIGRNGDLLYQRGDVESVVKASTR